MEFIDLKSQYQRLHKDMDARINAVLQHGHYILGPEVGELEERLAKIVSTKHCISCASGSDALLMALMALGAGPGDAVFVPAFSFFATAEMPALLGATPIFVDIDPEDFNMDAASLERAVRAVRTQDASLHPLPPEAVQNAPLRPRCSIPVDLFGQAADYDRLLAVAKAENLPVLEDAAQALGGTLNGKAVCGLGCDVAATSFFPAKPLGCYGDGGALFTDDDNLAAEMLSVRVHGKGTDKYDNRRIGINGRLDTLQAAILLSKLDIFPDELERRQQVAAWYGQRLGGLPGIAVPVIRPGRRSTYAQYTLRIAGGRRAAVMAGLRAAGIPANIYYERPLHVQGAFVQMRLTLEDLPVAAACSREVLSLPFHPYMNEKDVDSVCTAIARCCL